MNKLGKDQENWSAKLKVFKELVEHHIEEEEDEVFEAAESGLDKSLLNQMMETFEDDKQKIKKQIS